MKKKDMGIAISAMTKQITKLRKKLREERKKRQEIETVQERMEASSGIERESIKVAMENYYNELRELTKECRCLKSENSELKDKLRKLGYEEAT